MPAFDVIGPLPDAEVLIRWQQSERGVECSAQSVFQFTASTFLPSGMGHPFAVQVASIDGVTGLFVADFLLRDEQEWIELRFLNSDVGFVKVKEGVLTQTLALGVSITFEQEEEGA